MILASERMDLLYWSAMDSSKQIKRIKYVSKSQGLNTAHGPSLSGPYSRVRDLLATFTLTFSLIAR